MPWKLQFMIAVLLAAVSVSQQNQKEAPARTAATLSGTVIQADTRLPLKNVQIVAMRSAKPGEFDDVEDASAPDRQFSAKTDEKGHFDFANLPFGTYYVKASHAGMVMKGTHGRDGMLVTLEGGKAQTLELAMLPGSVITGRILNEEGEPMQNVSVAAARYIYTIAGRRFSQSSTGTSDDKGEYRLFGLQPGSYLIVAEPGRGAFGEGSGIAVSTPAEAGSAKPNPAVYTGTYYPNAMSPEQATPIVVKPGDEAQANFSLTRVPAHNISGTISGLKAAKTSEKGEEHYRFVTARREGSFSPTGMALVGKDSSFKISGVPSGKYRIVAVEAGTDNGSYGYKEVSVGSSDVTGVTISANSAGHNQITGLVRAEGEAKLDYSKLFVVLAQEAAADGQADAADWAGDYAYVYRAGGGYAEVTKDGSFKMDLAPSAKPYQVVLTASGSGFEDWFTSKVLIGGRDVLDSGFKGGEARAPLEIIISNKGAALEGIVLDAQQKPFSNAEVVAFPAEPKLRRRFDLLHSTTADQQGHFQIRGVRPGEYMVFAVEDSQEQPFTTDQFLKNNSARIQTVKLEGGSKQAVQLEVIRAQ